MNAPTARGVMLRRGALACVLMVLVFVGHDLVMAEGDFSSPLTGSTAAAPTHHDASGYAAGCTVDSRLAVLECGRDAIAALNAIHIVGVQPAPRRALAAGTDLAVPSLTAGTYRALLQVFLI